MAGTFIRNSSVLAAVLGASLSLAGLAPAFAAPAVAPTCVAPKQSDRKTVEDAWEALIRGGYPEVKSRLHALQQVFGRAPANAAAGTEESEVYGTAALILTLQAVQDHRYEDAIRYGQRGIALNPDHALLRTELSNSYVQSGRPAEGLAVLDGYLARHPDISVFDAGLVLRTQGFALIELGRLDEAEAAYRQALVLEPDHRGAQDELTYIAQLRSGGDKLPVAQTTMDKARSDGFAPKD